MGRNGQGNLLTLIGSMGEKEGILKDRTCSPVCAMLSRSVVSDSATPWTVARQTPLSMGILHGSGLPCPLPKDLPNPGIEPRSPALLVDSLPTEPPGKLL